VQVLGAGAVQVGSGQQVGTGTLRQTCLGTHRVLVTQTVRGTHLVRVTYRVQQTCSQVV